MAFLSRGLPKILYVDNGSAFKARQLEFIAASLQVSLTHAKPYTPQGKGKIERFFGTVRRSFMSSLDVSALEKTNSPLMELNEVFSNWLHDRYHRQIHSSTSETPIHRFSKSLELLRRVPDNLSDYFRHRVTRRVTRSVTKDRTVSLNGNLYEAPVDLIKERIELFYHPDDLTQVEAFFEGRSYGMLSKVHLGVNSRVKRQKTEGNIEIENLSEVMPESGKLF